MATHIGALHSPIAHKAEGDLVVRWFRAALNRFLLLPLGALVALVWANTEPETYFRMARALAFPVNEIAMAFFLALIAQELYEALMPGEALHEWRYRALPVVGALGGLIGSVFAFLTYVSLAHEQVLATAWPVVAAVDIAAGYYVLRLIYPRQSGTVAFLLLLAVITDVVAMAVVSVRAPAVKVDVYGIVLLLLAAGSALLLRRRRVKAFWPFWLIAGPLWWLALYWIGVPPALALVPLVPFLPHARRRGDVFADRPDDDDPVHHAEHEWNGLAQIALFLFGLVNAGVILRHVDTGTWAVVTAAMIGRPVGIILSVLLAVNVGLHLPKHVHWSDVVVVALATTSGFTFALFLTSVSLPIGAVSGQVTLGVLLTSLGAIIAVGVAWLLSLGTFKLRT